MRCLWPAVRAASEGAAGQQGVDGVATTAGEGATNQGRVLQHPQVRQTRSLWRETFNVVVVTFSYCLRCFDAVGWAAGTASGL